MRDDRARGHRVRAAPPRGVDRPGPARLRDRRRPHGDCRGRPRPPRLHDQRDGTSPLRRDDRRSVRRARGPRAPHLADRRHRTASPRIRCDSCAGCASSRSSISIPTSRRCEQMRAEASSGEPSSRASASAAVSLRTGWGSCRSCCSGAASGEGAAPRPRHRRARAAAARSSSPRSGSTQESRYHDTDRRRAHVRGRAGCRRRGHTAARATRRALPRSRQAAGRLARAPTAACTTTRSPATRRRVTSR